MRYQGLSLRFAATAVVLAMAPTLAFAYIDPGNGAYMVQALFTLVAAGMFYVRHPVRTVKLIMGSISKRLRKSNPPAPITADVDLAASTEMPGNGDSH